MNRKSVRSPRAARIGRAEKVSHRSQEAESFTLRRSGSDDSERIVTQNAEKSTISVVPTP